VKYRLRSPLFRVYDEDGNVGIGWRKPWYFYTTFNDVIRVQDDITDVFVKWSLKLDRFVWRWPDITPRDPLIHSTPARNPKSIVHRWVE